jgi:hypothetical protein
MNRVCVRSSFSEALCARTDRKSESGSRNHWLHREVLPINRGAGSVKASLEETLSSAVQATDGELGDMLHEIDEILHALRSHITPSTKLMTLFNWLRIGRGVRKNSSSPPWASPA